MATDLSPAEYGTVIRLSPEYPTALRHLRNYTLILTTEPLHVQQYCRTLTLAQGRLLYEVWDDDRYWHPRCVGYVVPSHLANEGRKVSSLHRSDEWKGLHPVVFTRYEEAWQAVVRDWPGLPVYGARRVVERLMRLRIGPGRANVEAAVGRYALRHWSAYRAKLDSKGLQGFDDGSVGWARVEEEVRRRVAERVMGVLRGWMRSEVSLVQANELFERLGLMRVERKEYGGVWFD